MPTGDPAIDAAFSDAPVAAQDNTPTGDAAIDSAFATNSANATAASNPYRGLPEDMNPEDDIGKITWPTVKHTFGQMLGGFLDSAGSATGDKPGAAQARDAKLGIPEPSNDIDKAVRLVSGFGAPAPLPEAGPAAAPMTAEQVLGRQAASSATNMGAAAAAPSLQNVSPALKQAVVDAAQKTGGAVNPDVLSRHIEADSLPVKMQLTTAQALQDPTSLSNEINSRGKNPDIAQKYNDQNSQLGQNLQAMRDQVGPDVFSTNQVEHGDTLIQAYKDKDAAAQLDINQKYKALRDANGGQFPVDANALLQNASANLHQSLLFDHAPKPVMSTLGRLADNDNMTFENFESLRTNLARVQRSSQDGNEAAAAGVIRNAMEELPLQPGAASLKPLADTARAAAKAQFGALEADPAYNAAVNDKVPPDQFAKKFVINAPRDNVALMKQNLSDNDTAQQTIGVSALDHLRDQARIDPQGNGNFAAASYNKALQNLSPKLSSLVDPQTAEQLSTLGNVARYVKGQPSGSFVNNSNTFTALAGEHAKGALEGAANVAAHGVPVGTWIRKVAQGRAQAVQTQQALAPYGGLTKLSDIAKP